MRKLVVAVVAFAAILAAVQPAGADWRWRRARPHYGPPVWVYPPPPPVVIYAPAPQSPPPPPPMVVYAPLPPAAVTPVADQGRYCREYQGTVMVGNAMQPSYGTACMQSDGSWQIVQ